MPVFGLAALWNGSSRAERVRELVEGLGALLPSPKPPGIVVALREAEATLELKLEVPSYPRTALEELTQQVQQSGGTLVELWRLPKASRDAFRKDSLTGPDTHQLEDFEAAAIVLHGHLQQLAVREPVPEGPPPGPASVPIDFFAQGNKAAAPPAPAEAPKAATPEVAAEPAPAQETAQESSRAYETFDTQRQGRRFAVKLEMVFRTELEFVREHATNISNGGLFVRTAHRPPVDSVVTVQVKLPNGERLQGDALVVHVVDDPYKGGVGLAFLNDDPTFAETLDHYLASLANSPAS
ncbi:TIGR02266 family protein [Archangium violaceum]|uniref:Pilus assembly protein PilZ n=1 Tax=Archangium violaceum Cb vi76 TaxID=1406225 RepID=A0A084SMQ2_9BACT|nr:TIGR02266 family protein [Archangium violaceum]KFA89737.1 pilus assembly protein PilZ [Archangium violaceum Cb vi76]